MTVKSHDFNSYSHYKLEQEQEPNLNATIPQNYLDAVKMYQKEPFMAYRAGMSTNIKELVDVYTKISFIESSCCVLQIINFLRASGVKKGDRIVIYAKNSPLWLLSDIATQFIGAITVPIYDTLGIDNIVYCLNLVKATHVIVSGDYVGNIMGIHKQVESLKNIISLDDLKNEKILQQAKKVFVQFSEGILIPDDTGSLYSMGSKISAESAPQNQVEEVNVNTADIDELYNNHKVGELSLLHLNISLNFTKAQDSYQQLQNIVKESDGKASDQSSVIFTSGTSGRPKGTILTHTNVQSGVACLARQFLPYHQLENGEQTSILSYLPLAHVFERAMEIGILRRGYTIYYSCGNIKMLTKDMELSKTTVMLGVPRVYSKIYNAINDKLNNGPKLVKLIFNTAYSIKKMYLNGNPQRYANPHLPIVDKVFSKIQKALGGKMNVIISGSSALPANVKEFLEVTSGARISSGYGLTEGSATGCYNYFGQPLNMGSQLGYMCWETQGKLKDCSDKCEFSLEKDNIGEFLIKSPGVAQGYIDGQWGQIKKITDDEGFYATGDLVKLHEDGAVSFIRRVGLVVKLQNGEFVDLEAIETVLETSPLIITAFVYAEADKTAPVAFVSIDKAVLEQIADSNTIQDKNKLEQFVFKYGDQLVRKSELKPFNVPKAYKIYINEDFTTNPEFYTPSSKKKHAPFVKAHQSDLAHLWELVNSRDQENKKAPSNDKINYKQWIILAIVICIIAFFIIANKK